MLTMKWTDQDGYERLSTALDVIAKRDGNQCSRVSWKEEGERACTVDWPSTVYAMNESGATVAKYVVVGNSEPVTACVGGK